MKETWKSIEGYEGLYEVSNLGHVKSLSKLKHTPQGNMFMSQERIMKLSLINSGYLVVTLSHNKRQKVVLVHNLVARAFSTNPEGLVEVNHLDGVKTNNIASNLEYTTHSDNIKHAFRIGLQPKKRAKSRNSQAVN